MVLGKTSVRVQGKSKRMNRKGCEKESCGWKGWMVESFPLKMMTAKLISHA